MALHHCFGTTYFCDRCHRTPNNPEIRDCCGVNCPLGVPHPPADRDVKKSTYALGCNICRSENLGKFRDNSNLIAEVSLPGDEEKKQKEDAAAS